MSSLNLNQYVSAVETFLQHFDIADAGKRSTVLIDVRGFILLDGIHHSYHGPVTLYVPTTYDGPMDTPIGKLLSLFTTGIEGVGKVTELSMVLKGQEYHLKLQSDSMGSVSMTPPQLQQYRVPKLDQVVIHLLNEIVEDPKHALFQVPNLYLSKYRELIKVGSLNKRNSVKVNPIVNELLQILRDNVASGWLTTSLDLNPI